MSISGPFQVHFMSISGPFHVHFRSIWGFEVHLRSICGSYVVHLWSFSGLWGPFEVHFRFILSPFQFAQFYQSTFDFTKCKIRHSFFSILMHEGTLLLSISHHSSRVKMDYVVAWSINFFCMLFISFHCEPFVTWSQKNTSIFYAVCNLGDELCVLTPTQLGKMRWKNLNLNDTTCTECFKGLTLFEKKCEFH